MGRYTTVHVQINHPIKGALFSQNTDGNKTSGATGLHRDRQTDVQAWRSSSFSHRVGANGHVDRVVGSSWHCTWRGRTFLLQQSGCQKKPSHRVMAAWINKTWEQGFEVSSFDCILYKLSFRLLSGECEFNVYCQNFNM